MDENQTQETYQLTTILFGAAFLAMLATLLIVSVIKMYTGRAAEPQSCVSVGPPYRQVFQPSGAVLFHDIARGSGEYDADEYGIVFVAPGVPSVVFSAAKDDSQYAVIDTGYRIAVDYSKLEPFKTYIILGFEGDRGVTIHPDCVRYITITEDLQNGRASVYDEVYGVEWDLTPAN